MQYGGVVRVDDEVIERLADLFIERELSQHMTFYQFLAWVTDHGYTNDLMFTGVAL